MSFLDVLFIITVFILLLSSRPLSYEDNIFDRESTSVLRGVAVIAIILHHLHNYLNFSSIILSQIGYLATGLFFFISGLGNSLSVNKNNNIKFKWILNKSIKIYIPFFVAYWIHFFVFLFIYPSKSPSLKEVVIDMISISLPNQSFWFPKIILLCFLIHWIAKKISKTVSMQNLLITTVIVVYIVITLKLNVEPYWYTSVLNYAFGCIVAQFAFKKKLINIKFPKRLLAISTVSFAFIFTFVLSFYAGIVRTLSAVFFSLVCFCFLCIFKSKNKILSWIGNNSFEFYALHIVCLEAFYLLIDINTYLYSFLVFVCSFILVSLYLSCKKHISIHTKLKTNRIKEKRI